jgi:large subunit ribosomal protein L25
VIGAVGFCSAVSSLEQKAHRSRQEYAVSEVRISAESRNEFGKGASRRARAAGRVPAVLYGHGTDPRHLTLSAREFSRAIKAGPNTVFTLDLGNGSTELALAKAVVRHPLKDYFQHVDLLLVQRGEKVTVDVHVIVSGTPISGTMVLNDLSSISIEVEALHIPESVEISVEGADAGTQILARDIPLPADAVLITDPEALVVGVTLAPTAAQLDADAVESGAAVEDAGTTTE